MPASLPNAGNSPVSRYFLKIAGIAGNSTVGGYEGWFEIQAHDFDVAKATTASNPQFSPLRVDLLNTPSNTPSLSLLYERIAEGTPINSLQIHGVADIRNPMTNLTTPVKTYELRFADAFVTGLDNENVAGDQQVMRLNFTANKFGVSTTPLDDDGRLGTAATYGFDIATYRPIGFSTLPVPGSLPNAGNSPISRYFLKIDGIAGNSTVSRYEGWFEIRAHDFDVAKASTTSKPEFSPLRVDLFNTQSTPSLGLLYERIAEGGRIRDVQIHGVYDYDASRIVKTYELRFADAFVTGLDNENFDGEAQAMRLTFDVGSFEVTTVPLGQDGKVGSPSTYTYTDNSDVICLARTALIAIPGGERCVADLQVGDQVLTPSGPQKVKFIGRSSRFLSDLLAMGELPIQFEAGALGALGPASTLHCSPNHAFLIDGCLVEAKTLLNGTSIRQLESWDESKVTYYSIELEEHGLVWANGLLTETFFACRTIDNDSREVWNNYSEYLSLYGEASHMLMLPHPRIPLARNLPNRIRQLVGLSEARVASAEALALV